MAYQYYMADSIYYYMREQAMQLRLYDMLHQSVDDRDAGEIISDTIKRAGLRVE